MPVDSLVFFKRSSAAPLSLLLGAFLVVLSGCGGATPRKNVPVVYGYQEPQEPKTQPTKIVSVGRRDTILTIAQRHGTSVQTLNRLNHLNGNYQLYVGQALIVPDLPGFPKENPEQSLGRHGNEKLVVHAIEPDVPPLASSSDPMDKEIKTPVKESEVRPEPVQDPVMPIPHIPAAKEPIKTDSKKETKNQKDPLSPEKKHTVKKQEPPQAPSEKKKEPLPSKEPKKEDAKKPEKSPASPSANPAGAMGFTWPVKGPILQQFTKGKNDGINIAAKEGTAIVASEDGTVAYAGDRLPGFGNLVMIKHRNGWMTAYAHAKDLTVKRGQSIKKGQTIGHVGQTGSVNKPQLHFEIRKRAQAVDPAPLVK